MKNKIITLLVTPFMVASVIVTLLALKSCGEVELANKRLTAALGESKSEIEYRVLENGKIMASKESYELSSKEDLRKLIEQKDKQLLDALKKFKRVDIAVSETNLFKVNSVVVQLHDTVPCEDFNNISFKLDTTFMKLSGKLSVKNKLPALNGISLSIPDSISTIIGEMKYGLFNLRTKKVASIVHSNPKINTTGLSSYEISEPKKWYNSKLLWIGLGLAGGFYIKSR